jgi:glycosyltransferase involved in cell wall biosynthesis
MVARLPFSRPWVVLRDPARVRWGGDLRRRHLLTALAEHTSSAVVEDWSARTLDGVLLRVGRRRRRFWRRRAAIASAELLGDKLLATIDRRRALPVAVDFHDDAVVQQDALGFILSADRAAQLQRRARQNLDVFAWHIVQSVSFAALPGYDPSRCIVASNGCDTEHIRAFPFPSRPTVGYVSAAAPRRGTETLIDAARLARSVVRDLQLCLWLVPTGDESQRYLDALRERVRLEPWIAIRTAAYPDLGRELAKASVLCVPSPPHPYHDAVLPIKLFDSMAAGRPVVVTPRTEMAAVIAEREAGLVAAGDGPEPFAAALVTVLSDPVLAMRLGANGRLAAETEFDWRVIGARLASRLMRVNDTRSTR